MRACFTRVEGNRSVFELREAPKPQARPGEVLIRVHAAALNRGELVVGSVMHGGGAMRASGTEAAGVVEALGEGVAGPAPGTRVMGRVARFGGAFADYACLEAHQAIAIPQRLSFEQAASIPVVFLVTYDMLYPYGRLQRGEWLLVTAASSGVGVASIQVGRYLGARVIGTSGSADKIERLKSLGMHEGIATRKADFATRVRELTDGHGADVIVNSLGGSVFAECVRCAAHKGRVATVGYVDGQHHAELDLQTQHAHRLELFGVSNSRLSAEDRAATVRGFVRDLLPAFADGSIIPQIDRVFSFDELPAAKAHMESNAQIGKIVVRIA